MGIERHEVPGVQRNDEVAMCPGGSGHDGICHSWCMSRGDRFSLHLPSSGCDIGVDADDLVFIGSGKTGKPDPQAAASMETSAAAGFP